MTQDKTQEALLNLSEIRGIIRSRFEGTKELEVLLSRIETIHQALQSPQIPDGYVLMLREVVLYDNLMDRIVNVLNKYVSNKQASRLFYGTLDIAIEVHEAMIEAYDKPQPHTCTASGFECLPPINEATGHDND